MCVLCYIYIFVKIWVEIQLSALLKKNSFGFIAVKAAADDFLRLTVDSQPHRLKRRHWSACKLIHANFTKIYFHEYIHIYTY